MKMMTILNKHISPAALFCHASALISFLVAVFGAANDAKHNLIAAYIFMAAAVILDEIHKVNKRLDALSEK